MVFDDLRSFLERLCEEGRLIRWPTEVRPEPDIPAIGRALHYFPGGGPAVLFDNIMGYGKGKANLVLGVHGSWEHIKLILGLPKNVSVKDNDI